MKYNAIVATPNSSRYLQQLSKHWGHKCPVEFTPTHSTIDLPLGRVVMAASESDLTIHLEPKSGEDVARLKDIVASHIDRFAHKEGPLTYDWQAL